MSAYLQRLFDRAAALPSAGPATGPGGPPMPMMVPGSPILAFDQRLAGALGSDFSLLGVSPEGPGGLDAAMMGALADPAPVPRPSAARIVDTVLPMLPARPATEDRTRRRGPGDAAAASIAPSFPNTSAVASPPPTVAAAPPTPRAPAAPGPSLPPSAPAPAPRTEDRPAASAPSRAVERSAVARPEAVVVERSAAGPVAAAPRSVAMPDPAPIAAHAASPVDGTRAQVAVTTSASPVAGIPGARQATAATRPREVEPAAPAPPPPLGAAVSEGVDRGALDRLVREAVRAELAIVTGRDAADAPSASPSATAGREAGTRPAPPGPRTAHGASVIGALEPSRRPLTLFGVKRR